MCNMYDVYYTWNIVLIQYNYKAHIRFPTIMILHMRLHKRNNKINIYAFSQHRKYISNK